jgi:hypothetical protein
VAADKGRTQHSMRSVTARTTWDSPHDETYHVILRDVDHAELLLLCEACAIEPEPLALPILQLRGRVHRRGAVRIPGTRRGSGGTAGRRRLQLCGGLRAPRRWGEGCMWGGEGVQR